MEPLINRIIPNASFNVNTFNEENRKITLEELIAAIKNTKQRAPGLSGITKRHLIEAPRKTLLQLLNIFNPSLNLGYFPDAYKTSKIIFIPKPNKSSKDPFT